MKKKLLFVLAMLGMTSFASLNVSAASAEIDLSVGYIDPTLGQGGPQRGPVLVPEVSIEDYTLTFSTPCYGWTLELLDEDGDLVYTTIITSDTLVLPSTLEGEYELCLYPTTGSTYFYGFVLF